MSKVHSALLQGLEAEPIEVEADILSGLHSFSIVGLADKTVNEARERVSVAIRNVGCKPPAKFNKKIIINLAPADIRKEGSSYDLAIAVAFLAATEQVRSGSDKQIFCGELALDGRVRKIPGALAATLAARATGFQEIYLPRENVPEVAYLGGIAIHPVNHLKELIDHLNGLGAIPPASQKQFAGGEFASNEIFRFIKGQEAAKRALAVAASGAHNVLLSGPPGTGKTILAQSVSFLLPPLSLEESIEVTKVYSALGLADDLMTKPPFRNPHHSASEAALLGGGTDPRPGEVSLAHCGVLFLDELPEFSRSALEGLREPLENGQITVSRAKRSFSFPARFIFIGAMNPCPCGFFGDPKRECRCSVGEIRRYQKKISGPLLDRIDMFLEVGRIEANKLLSAEEGAAIPIDNIVRARDMQAKRGAKNSALTVKNIKRACALDPAERHLLEAAADKHDLSPRAVHRLLKVARTIADMEGSTDIERRHLLEALQYRRFDANTLA